MAVVIPVNNPLGPADDTVTAPLCSTSTSTHADAMPELHDTGEPGMPVRTSSAGVLKR